MFEGLLQPQHLLIILAVALFVFGPKKLPELGQGLGKGIRSFKEGMKAGAEADTALRQMLHVSASRTGGRPLQTACWLPPWSRRCTSAGYRYDLTAPTRIIL